MSHATHCKDPSCISCSCTPDCGYWDEEPNVLEERERIIALLETKAEYFMACWDEEYDTAGLIALIKGENK